MRIVGAIRVLEPLPEEITEKGRIYVKSRDISVKLLEQQGSEFRVRMFCPKPTDFRFLEDVVTAQKLVRTLTCQYNLITRVAHELRKQEHRCRGCSGYRRLCVPNHFGENPPNIRMSCGDDVMFCTKKTCHGALEPAFVEILIVKCQGESGKVLGPFPANNSRDDEKI